MAPRTRYYGVYVGVISLLAFHVQKENSVRSYFYNGLRPFYKSLESDDGNRGRGEAVQVTCYSCSSKNLAACEKPDTNEYVPARCDITMMEEMKNNAKNISPAYEKIFEVAPGPFMGVDTACLKLVVQEGHKTYVLRGCQLKLGSEYICGKVEKKNTELLRIIHCSTCDKDACNKSMESVHFNAALTLICLVAYQAIFRFSLV